MYARSSDCFLPKRKCTLRKHDSYIKYFFQEYKSVCIDVVPRIKFHLYQLDSTCSLHGLLEEDGLICKLCDTGIAGKVRSRKILTSKKTQLEVSCMMLISYIRERSLSCLLYLNFVKAYI